jgi:hypothetical protein
MKNFDEQLKTKRNGIHQTRNSLLELQYYGSTVAGVYWNCASAALGSLQQWLNSQSEHLFCDIRRIPTLEVRATTLVLNVGIQLPTDAASYARRMESSWVHIISGLYLLAVGDVWANIMGKSLWHRNLIYF